MTRPPRRGFDITEERGAGQPAPTPLPAPAPPGPTAPDPAEPLSIAGEFRTAAAALAFAGSVSGIDEGSFGWDAAAGTWWVGADLTLPVGRELVNAAGGRTWIVTDDGLVADQGWGDRAPEGAAPRPGHIDEADVRELLRTAGLHSVAPPEPEDIAVLTPALRIGSIVQRALDLGLNATYRLLRLDPLFAVDKVDKVDKVDAVDKEQRTLFELRVTSPEGPLPAALVTALDRDPLVLLCRPVADTLLMQYGLASSIPDNRLAALPQRASGGWVMADSGFGCAQFTPLNNAADAAGLIRLADRHRLVDVDWAAAADDAGATPELPPLQLIRARTPYDIDAALLREDDLECLPLLLEGRHLADLAVLLRGRDRHLLTAPGGLLERLPIGEPLYRIGPGPLYMPLGYRMQPILPPAARGALLMTEKNTAVVLHTDVTYAFSLTRQEPVWQLWAGPLPLVDRQLPDEAATALAEVDRLVTPTPPRQEPPKSTMSRLTNRVRRPASAAPLTWRDEAREAELADDFVRAAELFERHNEHLRAAHMYEMAARRHGETRGQRS